MKILLVEDEPSLSKTISNYLKVDGYRCETATRYDQASEKISLYAYDCILLDLMLPDGNGFDLLKEIKQQHAQTSVIIISARNALNDKVTGLDLGADDYLPKPFHLAELQARLRAVIRRRKFDGSTTIQYNEITIDTDEKTVQVNGSRLTLTKKEFELLVFFMVNKKRVVTKTSIAEHLWGDAVDMADNFDFIYSHIKNLRKKIMEKGGGDYIKSVYGMGYRWEDEA
jgi:DNA-binding response OmpR family regulator